MGGLLLSAGLRAADLVAHLLPRGAAYALADLAGRSWYRLAPGRRAVVAANLARVCAATGRPMEGAAFAGLVRRAFVEHARYYLEVLRLPHDSLEGVSGMVTVDDWDHWKALLHNGAVVATLHFGNPEPYGSFLEANGLHAVIPIEEIRPKALFDYLARRRATGRGVHMVPVGSSRRPMLDALRNGGVVGIVSDRDFDGKGHPMTLFGVPTTLPTGAASLALMTGRPLLAAACWRAGPERFRARAWLLEAKLTGDRRTDAAALTEAMGKRFEEAIGANPEQWFGSFQRIWPSDAGPAGD